MKKISNLLFLAFFLFNELSGQEMDSSLKINTGNWLELSVRPINNKGEALPFHFVEEMPAYPGGYDSLAKFIMRNLDYPKTAIKDKIEGRVITSFVVDWEGKVGTVKTFKGVRYDLDSACFASISILPRWIPIKHSHNQDISFQFLLPIKFLLKDPKH
jgi:hypothetical protein